MLGFRSFALSRYGAEQAFVPILLRQITLYRRIFSVGGEAAEAWVQPLETEFRGNFTVWFVGDFLVSFDVLRLWVDVFLRVILCYQGGPVNWSHVRHLEEIWPPLNMSYYFQQVRCTTVSIFSI